MTTSLDPALSLLTDRLNKLPAKIGKKLSGLLALGHIDSSTLHTVLDAVDLAGHPDKVLWFTSSYLFLRSKGVPVGDVIAMAKQHHKRIHLEWSEKRWKDEHNRLSRLETLKRLFSANEQYVLSHFMQHLPNRFPGYLVKTSRRLGMEGFRQRHCVASYHDRLLHGYTAIACVFVDKVRWTVELTMTHNQEQPLHVGQIKTRFDQPATQAIRKRILEYLGIGNDGTSSTEGEVSDHEQQLMLIMPILKYHGVQHLRVEFSGSDDDGQIDSIQFDPPLSKLPDVIIPVVTQDYHNGQWFNQTTNNTMRLDDAMREIVYGFLDASDVNWYDDDGGQGHFHIDFGQGKIDFNVDVNYRETIPGYSHEWMIDEFYVDAESTDTVLDNPHPSEPGAQTPGTEMLPTGSSGSEVLII